MDETPTVEVRDDPQAHRYEAYVGDELAGFTAYDRTDGPIMILTHR
jgi:hypothetical protein